MRFVSIGLFVFGLVLWNYYDGVLMRNFTYFNQISVEYALLGSLNSVAFLMAAQTAMYVSGYEKASVFVMILSLAVLVYRPLFFLKFVGGEVSKAMLLLVLLGLALVFMTRRKGTAKSVAGYAALGLASFMMGLLVFGKINANSELIPRICDSSETACLDKLFNQRRLDVGFADMIQSKFYFEDCMYGEGGTFIDKAPARKCMDNFRPYQMPCEERGLAPEARISDLAKDVGASYLPWPPVDPAPKRASNPYAWMGVMMANEWFDNMFWIDLGIRAIYMVLIGALQVHPMENGKLTLERIAALDVRLVEVLFTLSAPTFGVCMIMLGMLDPYFDTSTLRVAAIMAGATTTVTTTWLTLHPGSPRDYSAESRGRLVFWRAAHAVSFLSAIGFTVTAMILRLEPYLVAAVLLLLCTLGSLSRSRREKAPVPSAKIYGGLFAACSVAFFAYGLAFGGYEYSHAHFVPGETGNGTLTVVFRYAMWAGFHAAMLPVFWRLATRTEDAAEIFRRLSVSASSCFGVLFPVALAQYIIRYRFASEICEGSAWCNLDEKIRAVEDSWTWNGSAWVGANDDWESVVDWAIRVREYQISEHRAETAVVAITMAVIAAFLPKQAAEDVKVSVRCLETVGLSMLEYAYGIITFIAMIYFTVADVAPTPLGFARAGAFGIASALLWCAVTDRKKELADLKKSQELAPESPEEETAKLRMFFMWFTLANLAEGTVFFWRKVLVDVPTSRLSIKMNAVSMLIIDINLPFKYLLWHSMKALKLDTVKGSTWVVLLHNAYRYISYYYSFWYSPYSSNAYGRENTATGRTFMILILIPELIVQADLWKNWRVDSRRFFWRVLPGLVPVCVYYGRVFAWVSMNKYGYQSEIDSVNHWFDFGTRCTKIAGYAQLSQTVSKPPAAIRDFVMRRVIENIASIAYFQLMMLATGPMVMYSFARIHLSIPRIQSRDLHCREYLNVTLWFVFYVATLGHFASKALPLTMTLSKIFAGWANAYCIWRVKDSSMADELRRTTMESRSSRLTRSLRASMAERKTLTEQDLPRVLDQSNANVGPEADSVK